VTVTADPTPAPEHDHLDGASRHRVLVHPFRVESPYQPAGDQPAAISALTASLRDGERFVTLQGITGSGKSATMAWTIESVQRPALVIAPNKALAAQLAAELRELLPDNRVCFFVSYYDSYTPESYVPSADLHIEKQASVNAEIDRLRHEATAALLHRRDTVVVASVSCIYGLGAPDGYMRSLVVVRTGDECDLTELTRRLVDAGYRRNDVDVARGCFAKRGDTLEIHLPGDELRWRVEFFGDTVERIRSWDPVAGRYGDSVDELFVWPATHYHADVDDLTAACDAIEAELAGRLEELREDGKLLEAQRLAQRAGNDLEMLREAGWCGGIENYSRWLDGRAAGDPPWTLLDYLADDAVVFLDESHVTVPQINGAHAGDASRKLTLIEHGFRLPSAADNRPLRFDEFLARVGQLVFVSATPGPFETESASTTVELVVRPTGLVDPSVAVHPTEGQLDDLLDRLGPVRDRGERALVTCTTKAQAEDLVEWLVRRRVKAAYLHSDVQTLERLVLLRDLRLGVHDVLVGVNLLREGLDLPEVSLVAVLDADKEGFLRSATALIQTIGRAARNANGAVVLYADRTTAAMAHAIGETERRRARQVAANAAAGVEPRTITTPVRDLLAAGTAPVRRSRQQAGTGGRGGGQDSPRRDDSDLSGLDADVLGDLAVELEASMRAAAEVLAFERAAALRDRLDEVVAEMSRRQSPA
jgi:excinuclease ABC subunit B